MCILSPCLNPYVCVCVYRFSKINQLTVCVTRGAVDAVFFLCVTMAMSPLGRCCVCQPQCQKIYHALALSLEKVVLVKLHPSEGQTADGAEWQINSTAVLNPSHSPSQKFSL